MKKNILVFPCGSEIGLDVYSSVCYSSYFYLIGGSSIDDHGRFVYEDYIPDIPYFDSLDFIPTLKNIIRSRNIDAIYPTLDPVLTFLKEHETELDCKVVASSLETTRLCLSKELTYQRLNGIVRVPKVFDPDNVPMTAFPVFAKPIVGYGSRGTMKLNSVNDVKNCVAGRSDMMILEYLPGEEYTVDCFTDKDGNLLYFGARIRNRIRNGISVNTYFVDDQEEFRSLTESINAEISFRGAWFFQVKRDCNGELCLLEVASRIGGSSLASRAIGVNLPLLSLFDIFDYSVDVVKNDYHVELDRALDNKYKSDLEFDEVYCDYDDCLILDKTEVNDKMVGFLYKCLNEHKKLYLLSKHEGDLSKELAVFRLNQLFDEVIHIGKDANKADYIHSTKAVFIDDSFAERLNIKNRLHIPVFSPDMIDILL